MLYTKSILKEKSSTDGIRISVMSRHTKNDGKTPDGRINEDSYDEWKHDLAPNPKLVGAFLRKEIKRLTYVLKYQQYLRSPKIKTKVKKLAQRSKIEIITILCKEESADFCHRRILAEEMQLHEPSIEIKHI